MTFVWITYHLMFTILYGLDILKEHKVIEGEDGAEIGIYCGFIILVSLMVGCLIDGLTLVIWAGSCLVKMIKNLWKACVPDNKI